MKRTSVIVGWLVLGSCLLTSPFVWSAENQKDDSRKGVTVEEFKRGLKSAAQNIEKEIPKIGPAIGETFKKHSNKESDSAASSSQSSTKEKK
ncbi:MAG TPA: hypothetical protein VH681_11005 [Nitrospiraceae bacterium]|jgi:hypothetical protein